MGKSIIKYLSSYKATIVLLLVYAFVLALATVIEKYSGTPAAKKLVYYSPALFLIYGLIVANFFAVSLRHHLFNAKKWGFTIVHLSFVVILTGALVTHIFSREGYIHLREGETTGQMAMQPGNDVIMHELPFRLELVKFTLKRYPGSSSPSSYESDLVIHADGQSFAKEISMNNVIDIKGYRLFQASYDKDEQGSILSVNQDVAGRNITYTGYILLLVGLICCFTGKNSRFRQLSRQLKQVGRQPLVWVCGLFFLLNPSFLAAQPSPANMLDVILKKPVNEEHAAKFGALPMQSMNGRIEPVNTFASEVLRKLHKSDMIGTLNPDQFLLSLVVMPEMWMHVPFITYKNKDIAFNYDITGKQCSYIELFDSNGNYKLEIDLHKAFSKSPSERSKYEKDLMKLDEQINIFHQLINLQMINIFPLRGETTHKWFAAGDDLSQFPTADSTFVNHVTQAYRERVRQSVQTGEWENADEILGMIVQYQQKTTSISIDNRKIKAELLYNKLDIFSFCKKIYLIFGGLLLLFSFIGQNRNRPKAVTWRKYIITGFIVTGLLVHMAGIGIRWYIADYAPWSNSYETMVYLSFITVLAGMFFSRQNTIPMALSTLFGGVVLFVSSLNWMNPQISPLVPVLKSPWLMIHVAVVMIAYGFFGISFLIGLTNLILLRINKAKTTFTIRIKELTIMNEMSLLAGLAFMTAGVFLGAVWANESWGRYWGWDPKETWALVTIVVYAVVTHLRLIRKWNSPLVFNLLSVVAFACVLMTYFGVNYLLSGMHSYN